MNINYCPIFVSSSDAYSDLWPAFFTIFKREWPDYKGQIILNTEKNDFSLSGLNIICTKVNPNSTEKFGTVLKKGLQRITGDHFLFFMIDYFIEKKVDIIHLQKLYEEFLKNDPEALFLQKLGPETITLSSEHDIAQMNIPASKGIAKESIFSFQTAFWRKNCMEKYVADWENPWFAEYFGCRRAKILNPKFWMLSGTRQFPIVYSGFGVLHGGGKWLDSAISRIDLNGVPLDMDESRSRRGTFTEPAFPRLIRIPKELKLIHERTRSMMSLFKLKSTLKCKNI